MESFDEASIINQGQWRDHRLYDSDYVNEVLANEKLLHERYPSFETEPTGVTDPSHDRRVLEYIHERRMGVLTSRIWVGVEHGLRQTLFQRESSRRYSELEDIDNFVAANFLSRGYSGDKMQPTLSDDEKEVSGIGDYKAEIQQFLAANPADNEWLSDYARTNGVKPEVLLERLPQAYDMKIATRINTVLTRRIDSYAMRAQNYVGQNASSHSESDMAQKLFELYLPSLEAMDPAYTQPRIFQLNEEDRQAVCARLFELTIQYHKTLERLGVTGAPVGLLGQRAGRLLATHEETISAFPEFSQRLVDFLARHPDLSRNGLKLEAQRMQDSAREHILELITNDDVNSEIARIKLGETVVAPGEGELGVIKRNDLGPVIEQHLRLAALARFGAIYKNDKYKGASPLGRHWQAAKIVKIADKLIGNFNGRISNLRFVCLPADPEYFSDVVPRNPEAVDQDSAIRFAIAVDLKSSGKPTIANLIDVVMYKRSQEENGMSVIASSRGRSKNEDPIEYLHLESAVNARRLEAQALRHTFSAGAGSLGKRR